MKRPIIDDLPTTSAAIFVLTLCGALVLALLPADVAEPLVKEGKCVENLSLVVLSCGTLLAGLNLWRCRTGTWGAVLLMFFWMFLRELDYQKLFTPRSIESIGYYSNPAIPFFNKVVAVLALAPFTFAGAFLLFRAARPARNLVLQKNSLLLPTALTAILLGLALVSEKLLPPRFQVLEEVAELGFVLLLTYFVAYSFRNRAGAGNDAKKRSSAGYD